MQRPTDTNGFTLVELAVSLVVIGLLIGLGTAMMGPLMSAIKVRESRENLGAAVESVNGWAAGNNRLPQWGDGVADATTDEFVEVARNSTDAWTRPFVYLFDANLFTTTPTKDTICGRRSTALTLDTTDPVATIPNVAYVVLSQGDNAVTDSMIGATPVSSSSITAAATVTVNTSDDLVRWVTLDELRTKVGCQGPQLRIVNNELPYGSVTSLYSSIIFADGGVPFATAPNTYKWCIEINNRTTLPNGLTFCSTNTNPCTGTAPLIRYTPSGQYCSNLPETGTPSWPSATATLYLTSGPTNPAETGSFNFVVYARDNNNPSTSSVSCNDTSSNANRDNCANKAFVLTINP